MTVFDFVAGLGFDAFGKIGLARFEIVNLSNSTLLEPFEKAKKNFYSFEACLYPYDDYRLKVGLKALDHLTSVIANVGMSLLTVQLRALLVK